MACGCAVVAINVDSLPEVIKDGGLLVENTEDAFYSAIKRLIENKNLREEYQKKGRERAKKLTWENVRRNIWNLIRKF